MRMSRLPLASFLLASAMSWSAGAVPAAAQSVLGVLVDSSGPNAELGLAMTRGASLAARHLRLRGAVGGDEVTLDLRDYAGDPAQARSLAQAMVRDSKPRALIGPCDEAALVEVVAVAAAAGLPVLCPVSLPPGAGGSVYRLAPDMGRQVDQLLAYAARQRGVRSVGLLHQSLPGWDWAPAQARRAAAAAGLTVAYAIPFDPDLALSRLPQGAEAVLAVGDSGFCATALARVRREAPGALALAVSRVLGRAPRADLAGVVAVDGAGRDASSREATVFSDAYVRQNGREPDEAATLTYEAVFLVREALRQSGGQGVAQALRSGLRYVGITGPLTFDSSGARAEPRDLVEILPRALRPVVGAVVGAVVAPPASSEAFDASVARQPAARRLPAAGTEEPWWLEPAPPDGIAPAPTVAAPVTPAAPFTPAAPGTPTIGWPGGAAPAPAPVATPPPPAAAAPGRVTPGWPGGSAAPAPAAPAPAPAAPAPRVVILGDGTAPVATPAPGGAWWLAPAAGAPPGPSAPATRPITAAPAGAWWLQNR